METTLEYTAFEYIYIYIYINIHTHMYIYMNDLNVLKRDAEKKHAPTDNVYMTMTTCFFFQHNAPQLSGRSATMKQL